MKARIATCLLLGLIAGVPVQATEAPTGTIIGRVVDRSTGLGLRFGNIVVLGTTVGSASRDEGRFVIQLVPAGEQRIKVTSIGYQVSFENVTVASGETTTVEIALARSTVTRDPDNSSGALIHYVCDPTTMRLPANADSILRARALRVCSVLGLEYRYELIGWGPHEDGSTVSGTLMGGGGAMLDFFWEGAPAQPRQPRCLYIGHVDARGGGAIRLNVGSELERALLDALHVWADEQIAPARRDFVRSESIALALTGVLQNLEKQRADWIRSMSK